VFYALGVNRVLHIESRVQQMLIGPAGERVEARRLDDDQRAAYLAQGWTERDWVVLPTDVPAYTPDWLLAHSGIAVGVAAGATTAGAPVVRWVSFVGLSDLAREVFGVAAALPVPGPRRSTQNREVRGLLSLATVGRARA